MKLSIKSMVYKQLILLVIYIRVVRAGWVLWLWLVLRKIVGGQLLGFIQRGGR